MATRTSRARRSRSSKPASPAPAEGAEGEAAAAEAKPAETADKANGKLPSHLTHHRRIARNLNGLLENYGELRRQVVQIERTYKRGDKDLDARIFQLTTRLDALEKKLNDFDQEMIGVTFESNLKIRGNTDAIEALWDALEAGGGTQAVAKRRREAAEREEARQDGIEKQLQEMLDKDRQPKPTPRRRKVTKAS